MRIEMALEYRALQAGLGRIERLDELSGDPVRDRLTAARWPRRRLDQPAIWSRRRKY